jgi:DNA (cytosine-5)-methyltransferase 1
MSKPFRVLDLFCAGGGASMGLHQAWPDAEITGVDINPQCNYPFKFIQGCAVDFLESCAYGEYDFIWASPPCQAHTRKSADWGRKRTSHIEHPCFIEATRKGLEESGSDYVIENVVGAPIRADLMLCGTMFGLDIRKHRHFECSFPIAQPECGSHENLYNPWQGKGRSADKMRKAMGIDWLPISGGASRKNGYTGDLFNAIPPAYSKYIAEQYTRSV